MQMTSALPNKLIDKTTNAQIVEGEILIKTADYLEYTFVKYYSQGISS